MTNIQAVSQGKGSLTIKLHGSRSVRRRKPVADLASGSLPQSSDTKGLTMRIINRLPNRRTFLVSFVCVTLLILITPSVVRLQNQSDEESQEGDTVLERGEDFHPPIAITLIKSQAGELKPGKAFNTGEDWF